MVQQEHFQVERWMDKYETTVKTNLAESCSYSLSLNQVARITGTEIPWSKLNDHRLVYGNIKGSEELRQAVADMCNEPSGPIKLESQDVLITNGAIGANFLIYYALAGPGDHIIVVDPTYQQLNSVPAMFGAEVEKLPLTPENNYLPDLDQLAKMIRPNTKMVNINSPHNPSGQVIPQDQLEKIVEICKKADCYLLCDEAYRPMFHGCEPTTSVATLYEKAIISGSTSKALGLAGLRTGWVVTPNKEVIETCMSRRDFNTICVSMIDDLLATWAVSNRHKILEHNYELCRQNLRIVDDFINTTSSIEYFKPPGGTTIFPKLVKVKDTQEFCHNLATRFGTLAVPGETFGKPGYLRIGYGNSREELDEGLENMKKLMIEDGYWD